MLDLLVMLTACLAAGIALWLAPASMHIVGWSAAGADRVAVFAPLYWLWIAIGGAVAAAALLSRRVPVRRAVWLNALWLWVVPYLPWLGAKAPLVLLLAGPIKWWIAAVAIVSVIKPRIAFTHSQVPLPVVFAVSFVLYAICGLRSYDRIGISGDEPHYLVITHSLLVDHDLQIENNHRNGDYKAFFPGTLQPDFLQRGVNDQIYSIHAPGLPALLVPGYAIAGARGAIVTVACIAALGAVAVFDMALAIGGAGVACLIWLFVCFSVPVVPHAWSLYPEAIAFAIVAWNIRRPNGFTIALLPWLHTKFVVLLAALTVWGVVEARLKGARYTSRQVIAFGVPIAISLAAWFSFFYVIYGTFNPQAPYGANPNQNAIANIPRGILGMLIDQKFGLLMYAPAFLAAAVGLWLGEVHARWRRLTMGATATMVIFVLVSARFYMWWGGSSAPARFLVPIVPLAAALVAIALTETRGALRGAILALGSVNVLVALIAVTSRDPRMLFSDPHGTSHFLRAVEGSVPADSIVPTFTEEKWPAGGHVPMGARNISAVRGRLELRDAYDPEGRRAFDYATLSKMSPQAWLERARVTLDPGQMRSFVVAMEPIAGRPNAFIAYRDDKAYPEGGVFWTDGTSRARLFILPAGARELVLTLHVGANGGTVSVDVDGRRQQLALQHDETRQLTVPLPAGVDRVPMTVESSAAFRPSEHDPKSSDTRSLGVQVRVELR